MKSEVKIFQRENNEIQRVHVVRWDDWSKLDFLRLKPESTQQQIDALKCFRDIYQNYLVPACPWIFKQMVMFTLPDDVEVADTYTSKKYGEVSDRLTIASILLEKGVKIKKGQPVFLEPSAEQLWKELEKRECVYIISGKLPMTQIIPVGKNVGYLSQTEPDAQLKVNANFFIMDPIDCATIYDQVGEPFGLCIKDGVIMQPPLFNREALMIEKDGGVYIINSDVTRFEIEVGGKRYKHEENAIIYTRPEYKKAPRGKGISLVIIGRRVVAVKRSGSVEIPASGFVMRVSKDCNVRPGDEVTYCGMRGVAVGIQVGNSVIYRCHKTETFLSRFYNLYHLESVPFPPSLYPMDFKKARAARVALGADIYGKPVLFWVEGKGKLGYTPGVDSTGASLSEMADIAAELGVADAINLDGGGSAQMIINGTRALRISDRNVADNSDAERLIPMGLMIK